MRKPLEVFPRCSARADDVMVNAVTWLHRKFFGDETVALVKMCFLFSLLLALWFVIAV